jgi:hypothetical protein
MLHVFIIPACLLVNLQAITNPGPHHFDKCETRGLFTGRVFTVMITPERVALN